MNYSSEETPRRHPEGEPNGNQEGAAHPAPIPPLPHGRLPLMPRRPLPGPVPGKGDALQSIEPEPLKDKGLDAATDRIILTHGPRQQPDAQAGAPLEQLDLDNSSRQVIQKYIAGALADSTRGMNDLPAPSRPSEPVFGGAGSGLRFGVVRQAAGEPPDPIGWEDEIPPLPAAPEEPPQPIPPAQTPPETRQ